ncbi:hypothetical protein ROJ8625_02272 [Roseivivax jejudonensis]|uniref:Isoprenylcysteine carboxyl methyltransferase (ICMT) family protein n=1 Tax=Roseivivax jejudonensis TaxID=1529041 RepID=A0A1X6ZBF0_9RHOB|nr:isoprenylcysteine carboxylmethyltransferase family protein [Roseivivax jejudonensis]SLN46896.1 hypothetical protein ROJ8625_02272 [Roseivivax jejudonensis]
MKWIDTPPVWLLGCIALAYAISGAVPWPRIGGPGDILGGALVAIGVSLIALAAREFRRHRTTIMPGETPERLITTGIFARSRNPIYLADLLILAGACLILDAPAALFLVPVLAAVLLRRFVLPEEARMRDKFVAEFQAYAQQTNRWL